MFIKENKKMKFTIMQTPHMSYRIECNKDEFLNKHFVDSKLKTFLDTVSFWGGNDSNSDVYFSWEIDEKIINDVKNILKIKFFVNVE